MSGEWSKLPSELLYSVGMMLCATGSIADFVIFGAVCKPWNTVFKIRPKKLPPQIPWQMITYRGTRYYKQYSTFYSLADDKYYLEEKKVPYSAALINRICQKLPAEKDRKELVGSYYKGSVKSEVSHEYKGNTLSNCADRFVGSGYGWLVAKGSNDFLINPVTKERINLSAGFSNEEMKRVVITADPTLANDVVIMAIVGRKSKYVERVHKGRLVYCKPQDNSWTSIHQGQCDYEGVAYCKSHFYALDTKKKVVVIFNIESSSAIDEIELPKSWLEVDGYRLSIIESLGEILLLKEEVSVNTKFDVCKLDQSSKTWSIVKSLGDRAIFWSPENSVSVVASNHSSIRRDCVYSIESSSKICFSIFNISDESYECLRSDAAHDLAIINLFWITPSLW